VEIVSYFTVLDLARIAQDSQSCNLALKLLDPMMNNKTQTAHFFPFIKIEKSK
jgi:hypothetical protein